MTSLWMRLLTAMLYVNINRDGFWTMALLVRLIQVRLRWLSPTDQGCPHSGLRDFHSFQMLLLNTFQTEQTSQKGAAILAEICEWSAITRASAFKFHRQ